MQRFERLFIGQFFNRKKYMRVWPKALDREEILLYIIFQLSGTQIAMCGVCVAAPLQRYRIIACVASGLFRFGLFCLFLDILLLTHYNKRNT